MSSASPIQHFTHVHPLTKVDGYGKFICDGCNTEGFGITYRCVSCDYDLHDLCATCPPTLLSFMHPQHELQRVFTGPGQRQLDIRKCNICEKLVKGLYYHCEPCDFHVHPLCTQLPQYVKHVSHPDHLLELSHLGACNMCEVCRSPIPSWRYKCGLCRFDVHMKCVNSSATQKMVKIQHFTHIHPLTEFNGTVDFICDGCKTYGSGKTYQCQPCNYDLHEYCATGPLTLTTFIHPQHELNLVQKQKSMPQNNRLCDICIDSVDGLFYRCRLCDFDVHPLCTQLPQHVRHVLHPAHHLELRLGEAGSCMVCHNKCQSWRYMCELCKFNIHMECILDELPSDQTEPLGTMSRVSKPHGQPSSSAPPMGQVRSKRRRMFTIARKLTVAVVSNVLFGGPIE